MILRSWLYTLKNPYTNYSIGMHYCQMRHYTSDTTHSYASNIPPDGSLAPDPVPPPLVDVPSFHYSPVKLNFSGIVTSVMALRALLSISERLNRYTPVSVIEHISVLDKPDEPQTVP